MPAADAEYERATALEKDQRYPEAMEIYHALADRGHARAALALSTIYLNSFHRGTLADLLGIGKAQDSELGQLFLLKAAQQGSSIAQWNMALNAFDANEFAAARKWAAQAADHQSEFTVGSLHCTGLLAWLYANGKAGTNDRRHGVRLCGLYRELCRRAKKEPIAAFDVQLEAVETVLADSYAKAWFGLADLGRRPSIAEPWRDPDERPADRSG